MAQGAIRATARRGRSEGHRKRVGKGALMHVWPSRGLAVSMTRARDAIELLEVFPPTTLDTYRRDIWRDPGPFTK